MKLVALILMSLVLMYSGPPNAQDTWQLADTTTVRLSATAFPQLPKNIATYLQARGCTVPQAFNHSTAHNVVRGQFARRGQFDWAVLCSHNRVSSILVFWHSSVTSIAEIARADDKDFLQKIDGAGNIGFSRAIAVVGRDLILEHYKAYGGMKPPPIFWQGINDAYVEKASVVHYFYRKRWLQL